MTGRFLIAACAAVVVAALALMPVTAQTDAEHWDALPHALGRPRPAGRLGERLRNTAGATEAVR